MGNCSSARSKEHYISEGILARLNDGQALAVSGLPWIPQGQSRNVSPEALGSNVLCKRHNEAFSALDAAAVELFEYLEAVSISVAARGSGRSAKLVSGDAVKLWALKALCGFCASGQAVNKDGKELRAWTPPTEWINALEQRVALPESVGVYFLGKVNMQFEVRRSASISPAFSSAGDPVGLIFSICGYPFALAVGRPTNFDDTVLAAAPLHPGHIAWSRPGHREARHHLILSWTPPTGPSVVITA